MGCGGSSGASDPSAEKVNWGNAEINDDFKEEQKRAGAKKKTFDKKTGKAVEKEKVAADREFDFFEGADAGSGEQFMAVRPYEGAIMEPTQHNEPSNSAPDVTYELEYVYGYRAEDSRMNCFYNKNGNVVYFTAALGVILDQDKNTQKFFGGGQTDNTSKQVARDDLYHTNDITAMDTSNDRTLCATGQNGSVPVAFVWDAVSGAKKGRYKLDKGGREVTAIAIHPSKKYVAMCCNDNDHQLYIFDVDKGTQLKKDKSGPDRIFHMAWSLKDGDSVVATAGEKHFAIWDMGADSFKKKKGIYGDKGKPTSHSCVCWDDAGNSYTGGANASIYVWTGQNLTKTYEVHGKGFVGAIRWWEGKIISGGKDGKIVISNPEDGKAEKTIDVGDLVRSVDMKGSKIIAGLRSGTIVEIDSKGSKKEVMKSHSDGEAWGIAVADKDTFVTSGDDNKIYVWDLKNRKSTGAAEIWNEDKNSKAGGASSLTEYAPSKCARSVAVNVGGNGNIAIGHNDGRVTIRKDVKTIDKVTKTLTDSSEWVECMAYSPDGSMLAVGSHDNNIYIYSSADYSKLGTLKGHNSFLVSVDWSSDGTYIRSVWGAHELLFFTLENFKQDPSGASNTVETAWHTSSAKYGWLVSGIFPAGTDGTHINHVDFSNSGNLIVTADDYGLVNVWKNPARTGATPISLRGHSEHVVRTYFTHGEDYILSIGGYDKAIMQWKKK